MPWTLWLAACAPLPFLAAALAPGRTAAVLKAARLASWLTLAASLTALASALIFGAAATPSAGVAGLGLAVRVDVLSAVLSALISFVGLVVVGYSRNYLGGDPRQGRFVRTLCLTLGLVLALVLAGNLAQLVFCWIGASVAVNRLLLFRGERQAAVLAARKRFLVCRASDLCLIVAAALLWRASGSADISEVLAAAKGASGAEWTVAAVLLSMAAVLSSAQLPFHGWILEVMETPTPVSALLHAGVVNAGGFLVLRFGEVVAGQPAAMLLLIVVGAATALFGSLVMLTQTSVKVGLAYSTIAQMGFMLLECGLGAFSAALLHIVAHSLYKAYAFLSAGGAAAPKIASPRKRRAPAALAVVAPLMVAVGGSAAAALGVGPALDPGAFVLGAVLLLGLARLWLDAWERGSRATLIVAAASPVLLLAAYALSQALFAGLAADLTATSPTPSRLMVVAAIATVTLMTALVGLQLLLPGAAPSPAWIRAYALVSNGFHLNTIANRWVLRFWPAGPRFAASQGAIQ